MVIANGHYRFPRFLDVPGLEKWLAAGKAAHSAWYRRSGDSGSPFLIVGGNFSGRDIVTDITSLLPTSVVHLSVREPPLDPLRNDRVQYRGQAVEFLAIDGNDKGKIRYEGGTEDEIDSCVLATGYKMTCPFFSDSLIQTSLSTSNPNSADTEGQVT